MDNVDDFTINLVITVIVLLIGLALVCGEYDISIACPCRECDVRSPGCGRICSDYKKYKFVLAILNGKRQAKAKAAAECREMRNERIRE